MGFPCMIYSTDILITLHPFPKATAPFIIQQRHTNTALCFITSQLLNQVQHFCSMFKILWWLEKQQPGCHSSNLDCSLKEILINSFELHFCFVRPDLFYFVRPQIYLRPRIQFQGRPKQELLLREDRIDSQRNFPHYTEASILHSCLHIYFFLQCSCSKNTLSWL